MDLLIRFIVTVVIVLSAFKLLDWLTPYDETDAPPKRSGVSLIVDHGTGCQYLKPLLGNLIPRVDAAGKHICK